MKEASIRRLNKLVAPAVIVILAGILSVSLSAQQQAQDQSGAKRLFYDPATGTMLSDKDKKQKTPQGRTRIRPTEAALVKYPGIHYWIELEGIGAVTDKRVFRTGDRIRLHVRSNVDGYLSLWTLDPSGKGKVLFPSPSDGGAGNSVKADFEFALPGYIKFSPPPEEERLLIFFSRNKDDVPKAQDSVTESSRFLAKGQKSLEFETDDKNMAEVGTYVVSRQGGAIAAVVRLQHKEPNDSQ